MFVCFVCDDIIRNILLFKYKLLSKDAVDKHFTKQNKSFILWKSNSYAHLQVDVLNHTNSNLMNLVNNYSKNSDGFDDDDDDKFILSIVFFQFGFFTLIIIAVTVLFLKYSRNGALDMSNKSETTHVVENSARNDIKFVETLNQNTDNGDDDDTGSVNNNNNDNNNNNSIDNIIVNDNWDNNKNGYVGRPSVNFDDRKPRKHGKDGKHTSSGRKYGKSSKSKKHKKSHNHYQGISISTHVHHSRREKSVGPPPPPPGSRLEVASPKTIRNEDGSRINYWNKNYSDDIIVMMVIRMVLSKVKNDKNK